MRYLFIALGLMVSVSIVNATSIDSLSYRKLTPIVTNTQVTPLLSRIQARHLTDEHITFFYKADHSFVMQVNNQDKILGKWHIAPNGKLCRYFDVARKSVLCDYWYDLGAEYLVVSTNGELHSIVPKENIKPLAVNH